MPGIITAIFCSNDSDGRIRAFYSTFLRLDRDNPLFFLAGPHISATQISCQLCSYIDNKESWAHQILQRATKISKGPLELCNLHVFEWDMGHSPILRAHHHFGPGLSLNGVLPLKECM